MHKLQRHQPDISKITRSSWGIKEHNSAQFPFCTHASARGPVDGGISVAATLDDDRWGRASQLNSHLLLKYLVLDNCSVHQIQSDCQNPKCCPENFSAFVDDVKPLHAAMESGHLSPQCTAHAAPLHPFCIYSEYWLQNYAKQLSTSKAKIAMCANKKFTSYTKHKTNDLCSARPGKR